MNKVTTMILTLALAIGASAVITPAYVGASPASEITNGVNSTTEACVGNTGKDAKGNTCATSKSLPDTIITVVNTMLYVLGALAVIMIIVGGIRYTTSNGDASKVKGAKDTLTYSIVGLIVALFAFAIVNFVIKSLGS